MQHDSGRAAFDLSEVSLGEMKQFEAKVAAIKAKVIFPEPFNFKLGPEDRLIPLNRGYAAVVSIWCYYFLIQFKWHVWFDLRGQVYAARTSRRRGKKRMVYMHRYIEELRRGRGLPTSIKVDHRNRCGLDNRDENLRPANNSENQANRLFRKNSDLPRGVKMKPGRRAPYQARVHHKGKAHISPHFTDKVSAGNWYNAHAVLYYGYFAVLNFGARPEDYPKELKKWESKRGESKKRPIEVAYLKLPAYLEEKAVQLSRESSSAKNPALLPEGDPVDIPF